MQLIMGPTLLPLLLEELPASSAESLASLYACEKQYHSGETVLAVTLALTSTVKSLPRGGSVFKKNDLPLTA